ncbi:MAG: DUF1349 domain-containing protein [Actinomycetota bacterium]|nr:DUF1349 domain-containing protein [Actinomycetota bacterium]
MSTAVELPGVPFPLMPSDPDAWRVDEHGTVVASAPAGTDLFVSPGGSDGPDGGGQALLNAVTLLGEPQSGDLQLGAQVSVDFRARFDAGVLLVWLDETHWAKLCFERSPSGAPMVVSVVTRGTSDDANGFVVTDPTVWLRISRVGRVYAFHASIDGQTWELVRVFELTDDVSGHRLGLEVQAPTGPGCMATFERVRLTATTLEDLRDGS